MIKIGKKNIICSHKLRMWQNVFKTQRAVTPVMPTWCWSLKPCHLAILSRECNLSYMMSFNLWRATIKIVNTLWFSECYLCCQTVAVWLDLRKDHTKMTTFSLVKQVNLLTRHKLITNKFRFLGYKAQYSQGKSAVCPIQPSPDLDFSRSFLLLIEGWC